MNVHFRWLVAISDHLAFYPKQNAVSVVINAKIVIERQLFHICSEENVNSLVNSVSSEPTVRSGAFVIKVNFECHNVNREP